LINRSQLLRVSVESAAACLLTASVLSCGDLAHLNPVDPETATTLAIVGPSEIHNLNDPVPYSLDVEPPGHGFVTWSSSNPAVLSSQGSGTFRSLADGKSTITATLETHSTTYDVTVRQVVRSHTFSFCNGGSTTFTSFGEQRGLCASASDSIGTPIAAPPTFSTSDSTIVALSYLQATAVRDGTVLLRAKWATAEDSFYTTVRQRAAAVSVVSDNGLTSMSGAGGTLQLHAVAYDANTNPVVGHPVRWSTDRPGFIDVSSTGLVTARGVGTANISAAVDSATGSILVRGTTGTPPTFANLLVGVTPLLGTVAWHTASLGSVDVSDAESDADSLVVLQNWGGVGTATTIPLASGVSTQSVLWMVYTISPPTPVNGTVQAADLTGNVTLPLPYSADPATNSGGPALTSATATIKAPGVVTVQVTGVDSALDVKDVYVTPAGLNQAVHQAVTQPSANFTITFDVNAPTGNAGVIVVLRDSSRRLSVARFAPFGS